MEKELTASVVPCSARPLKFDESLCVGCNPLRRCMPGGYYDTNPVRGKHLLLLSGRMLLLWQLCNGLPNKGAISLEHPLMNQAKFVPVK